MCAAGIHRREPLGVQHHDGRFAASALGARRPTVRVGGQTQHGRDVVAGKAYRARRARPPRNVSSKVGISELL